MNQKERSEWELEKAQRGGAVIPTDTQRKIKKGLQNKCKTKS